MMVECCPVHVESFAENSGAVLIGQSFHFGHSDMQRGKDRAMHPVQNLNDLLQLFFGSDGFAVHFHIDGLLLIILDEIINRFHGSSASVIIVSPACHDKKLSVHNIEDQSIFIVDPSAPLGAVL